MKQTLTQKLESLSASTPETIRILNDLFAPISFRKGTLFNFHEQAWPMLYFIEMGLVRGYVFYQKEEYTCWALETGFLLPVNPAVKSGENEYIEFMTESSGWFLDLAKAALLAETEPLLYRVLLEIQQECIQEGKIRELVLRLGSAEEQFLFMKKHHAALLDKLPHQVLASLLNVKPKYLYKLKKKHIKVR